MSQKPKALQVEVGIPALNEAANIKRVLKSVSHQIQRGFEIKRIILISDGSTDDTVSQARSLHLPNLRILENSHRRGVPYSWGRLFRNATAEILVLLDADTELNDRHAIANLISPMLNNYEISLVSGRPVKQSTGTFIDRVMDISIMLQDYIKLHLRNGRSVYGCHGRFSAVRRDIYRQVGFPPVHILGNDSYLFFFNEAQGGEFQYVPEAVATFKMPQQFRDFHKQARRFARTPQEHALIFGDWVFDEYAIPWRLKFSAILYCFGHRPFFTICYLLFRFKASVSPEGAVTAQASWEAATTKRLD